LSIEDVERPEQTTTVDINLLGVLYFVRIALPHLRLQRKDGEDKSLVLVGSAAGFRESPGLPVYQATKHGVQGIMRSLRKSLWDKEKIRINVLCPGVTDTNMADVVAKAFREAGLQDAVNVPEEQMFGKAVYVEGAKGWELETGYWDTMPIWLGEGPTQRLWDGLKLVASVRTHFRSQPQMDLTNKACRAKSGSLCTRANLRKLRSNEQNGKAVMSKSARTL
jgi:NAD(P)-dependent dehydrogenase (short-subunit alcohol dehydrogenase family)